MLAGELFQVVGLHVCIYSYEERRQYIMSYHVMASYVTLRTVRLGP